MLATNAETLRPGMIGTVAGTGEPGHDGDGGPAFAACLNEPKNLALDSVGGLYIADSENHLVRKVDLNSGIISTVAGLAWGADESRRSEQAQGAPQAPTQEEDPFADPSPSGPERFAQLADVSGTVRFTVGTAPGAKRFHGDGAPAATAMLNFPSAVAVDNRNLYIADTMNHRVRRIDLETGVITTLAGTGQKRLSGDRGPAVAATLNEPCALALDGKGSLYVADQSNHRVRRVNLEDGIITTVAGTGEAAYSGDGTPAAEATLNGPSGLAIGQDGALYIADTFNGRIRRIDPDTGLISTVVGDGGEYRYQGHPNEFSTSLSRPYGIAVDGVGNILITDSDSHLIRLWDRTKRIVRLLAGNGLAQFSGDGRAPSESSLNYPFGVAVDGRGNVYIADTFNHRIRMIAA